MNASSRSPSVPQSLHNNRNHLMKELEEKGIATRPGTHAVALHSYYQNKYDHIPKNFLISYMAQQLSLALPMYVGLSEKDQKFIVETIKSLLEEFAK